MEVAEAVMISLVLESELAVAFLTFGPSIGALLQVLLVCGSHESKTALKRAKKLDLRTRFLQVIDDFLIGEEVFGTLLWAEDLHRVQLVLQHSMDGFILPSSSARRARLLVLAQALAWSMHG